MCNGFHFNPRSPCGERLSCLKCFLHLRNISIHAPRVGSDPLGAPPYPAGMYFNPRSPCGERLLQYMQLALTLAISIHAPRVGSDRLPTTGCSCWHYFNPRSPCGERQGGAMGETARCQFQSTLPVWGATFGIWPISNSSCISIHAPRVGSDCHCHFNHLKSQTISIHAPRVGSDDWARDGKLVHPNFNPRSPCGERPLLSIPTG